MGGSREPVGATLGSDAPGLMGFTRANLFRMRQFHEAYRHGEQVSALLRQLPWAHNVAGQMPRLIISMYLLTAGAFSKRRWIRLNHELASLSAISR